MDTTNQGRILRRNDPGGMPKPRATIAQLENHVYITRASPRRGAIDIGAPERGLAGSKPRLWRARVALRPLDAADWR